MAEMELALDDLRVQVRQGREYTLAENFYFNNSILIGTERVLSEKDLDRIDGKCGGFVRVREYKTAGVGDSMVADVVQLCIRILKEHKDYNGLHSEKRKRIEVTIANILPTYDYLILRLAQMRKLVPRLFVHSVNTAIKALLIDNAWQVKYNQGMQNSIRSEEILVGAILRNIGFLKTSREVVAAKIGELRLARNPLYLKVPELSAEIIEKDRDKHEIDQNILRIVRESFEYADGSGFPKGLRQDEIYPLALLVSLSAEFDLLLSGELSQNNRSFPEVLRRLMSIVGRFDKNLVTIISEEFRYLLSART